MLVYITAVLYHTFHRGARFGGDFGNKKSRLTRPVVCGIIKSKPTDKTVTAFPERFGKEVRSSGTEIFPEGGMLPLEVIFILLEVIAVAADFVTIYLFIENLLAKRTDKRKK